jgi:hypothetical protein
VECPQKIRLQLLYEAAIRHWARIQASSEATPLSEEIRKTALTEYMVARNRLAMHKQHCNNCRGPTI